MRLPRPGCAPCWWLVPRTARLRRRTVRIRSSARSPRSRLSRLPSARVLTIAGLVAERGRIAGIPLAVGVGVGLDPGVDRPRRVEDRPAVVGRVLDAVAV